MNQCRGTSRRNGPATAFGTLFIAALIVVGCGGSGTGGGLTTGGTTTGGTTTGGTTTGGTTTGGTTGTLAPMQFVYTSNATGIRHIYKANDDGTGAVQLTNDALLNDNDPAWNAATDMIVFVRGGQLMTMNSDGTGQTPRGTIPDVFQGTFSPDGSKIVYSNSTGIYVHTIATGMDELLVIPTAAGDAFFMPNFSRDGTKIYFVRFVSAGSTTELRRMNADGTENVLIYASPNSMSSPFESHDGTKLFISNGFLLRMDLDGSNVEAVSTRTSFSGHMALDGSRIIYFSGALPDWEIYRMRADGTEDTKVLDAATALTSPRYPE